jgi:putative hemolysin
MTDIISSNHMSKIFWEVFLIIVLIFLNGFFSLSEIALISSKKSKLRHWAKQGSKRAEAALALTRRSPEMLSTIQIGISVIGIFAGAFGGATLAEYIEGWFSALPALAPYAKALSIALVVLTIAYFSIILGELVPKQIALSNPEKLAVKISWPIQWLMRVMTPLVKPLTASTAFVLRLLGIKPATEQLISEEEIKLLIAEGTETGIFEKSEQRMVESIFYMGNRPIRDFMTARSEIVWLDINDSPSTIQHKITGSVRSVFPVSHGDLDNNVGVVEIKDIITHLFDNGIASINLKRLLQPVMHIDASVPALAAIERLKRSTVRFAIITEMTDDNVVGIVTFHDILEAIVGEIKAV